MVGAAHAAMFHFPPAPPPPAPSQPAPSGAPAGSHAPFAPPPSFGSVQLAADAPGRVTGHHGTTRSRRTAPSELTRQFAALAAQADVVRLARLEEAARLKALKPPRVGYRRPRSVGEAGSDSSSEDAFSGKDRHPFRKLAHDAPGRIFSNLIGATRTSLGATLYEGEPASQSAVFQRWYQHHFKPRQGSKISNEVDNDITFLVNVLDELANGRSLEAADMIGSRLQSTALGISTGNWGLARQVEAFRPREHSLMSNESVELAIVLAKRDKARSEDLAAIGNGVGRGGGGRRGDRAAR